MDRRAENTAQAMRLVPVRAGGFAPARAGNGRMDPVGTNSAGRIEHLPGGACSGGAGTTPRVWSPPSRETEGTSPAVGVDDDRFGSIVAMAVVLVTMRTALRQWRRRLAPGP
ncbi:hypothetical protein [Microbacterium gorillae]|uniref:hypothetical protein n=1 Tax=Microbacterium gorillae TaxID=1231063 RepID=UPI00058CF0B5|nr:hypothetical protein [Microbacterium gorillae]